MQGIVDSNPSRLRHPRVTDLSPEDFLSNQPGSHHNDASSGGQRPYDALCGPYLSVLDTSLAQDRYKDLESVHFEFLTVTKHTFDTTKPPVTKSVLPECQAYVLQKLPKLLSRGVKISVSCKCLFLSDECGDCVDALYRRLLNRPRLCLFTLSHFQPSTGNTSRSK